MKVELNSNDKNEDSKTPMYSITTTSIPISISRLDYFAGLALHAIILRGKADGFTKTEEAVFMASTLARQIDLYEETENK